MAVVEGGRELAGFDAVDHDHAGVHQTLILPAQAVILQDFMSVPARLWRRMSGADRGS